MSEHINDNWIQTPSNHQVKQRIEFNMPDNQQTVTTNFFTYNSHSWLVLWKFSTDLNLQYIEDLQSKISSSKYSPIQSYRW
jgi:plasmid replication initiation protein